MTERVLGAIIAGGQSRRFGSDKAVATYRGSRLIDHVAARLEPQVDAVILCGRTMPGWTGVADRPHGGLGPLAGINAALHHAWHHGFDSVLSVPCDVPELPADLLARCRALGGFAYVADLPVIALWPAAVAEALAAHLAVSPDRSVQRAARALGGVPLPLPVANINAPSDLRHLDRPAFPEPRCPAS